MALEESNQIFERPNLRERGWLLDVLRTETVGGIIMLAAAFVALLWANSAWGDAYHHLAETHLTIPSVYVDIAGTPRELPLTGVDLALHGWAADALLALFFFLAGLELKHEFVHGSLSKPAKAAVPIVAALAGMVLPALIYLAFNYADEGTVVGWGIPMATDIAFALAVLAIVGRGLPLALRAFLLTLAVVDDLGAIIVIAVFYTVSVKAWYLVAAIPLLALYWWLQHGRGARLHPVFWFLFVVIWWLVYKSGVHPTVAGVLCGLLTRISLREGETVSPGDLAERRWRPFVAGFAVPVYAFFAAGVDMRESGFTSALSGNIAIGVILGLIIGKPLGVLGGSWLMARFTKASLSSDLRWADLVAVGLLAGIGFTVSLLISELAFDGDALRMDPAKAAVLAGSVGSALLAVLALLWRNASYRRLQAVEEADADNDGIPDVYQEK